MYDSTASLPEVGGMKRLETLAADFNQIGELPDSICQLTSLTSITLCHNKLLIFPPQLCSLPHLDCVDLSSNQIRELPSEIDKLQAVELNLSRNQVS